MTEAQTILAMIEQVDPEDEKALSEIDARVWAYLKLVGNFKIRFGAGGSVYYRHNSWSAEAQTILHHSFQHDEYTRSRDALKSIRPEGYISWVEPFDDYGRLSMGEAFEGRCQSDGMSFDTMGVDAFKTEELAELHVIIQALAYNRDNP